MIDTIGKDIHQVSKEIFQALVKQGEPCMFGEECVYGNSRGQHCAVGFLLPENNQKLMDFEGSLKALINAPEIRSLGPNQEFIKKHFEVLNALQWIHDNELKMTRLEYKTHLSNTFNISNTYIDQWVEMGD